jgi:signal recognition particle GTPase
MRATE